MIHLQPPPYHRGPLPALRLSPLPISTGSHFSTHSRFRYRNYRHAGQTATNTHRLEYYPVAVARASLNGDL